jgi:hypothetical protein
MKAWLVGSAIAGLARTWRLQVEGAEHLAAARARGTVLFAPWHEAMIPLVWWHRGQGITLLVGRHGDAELLADPAHRWGYGLARGSSSRGGTAALHALIAALRSGADGAVTPDGPRGPRRRVKPGVLKAAQAAGAAVVPVTALTDDAWRLRSWDRMLIPKPFARIVIRYGAALAVPADADPRGEPARALQEALDRMVTS